MSAISFLLSSGHTEVKAIPMERHRRKPIQAAVSGETLMSSILCVELPLSDVIPHNPLRHCLLAGFRISIQVWVSAALN